MICAWFRRYVHGEIVVAVDAADPPKPADVRAPEVISAARMIQVEASQRYKRDRCRHAARHESKRNTRSYSTTITGAVIIDSLHNIPAAHAMTASTSYGGRASRSRPGLRASRRARAGRASRNRPGISAARIAQ